MNKDKKLCLLLMPLIFMVLIFVPAMIVEFVPYMQESPEVIRTIFAVILVFSGLIWYEIFDHIPIGVYIVMLAIYTAVSWTWILKQKKGNAMYFIVWFVLCVLSILMYWKWGELYHAMMWI